jgi:FkbM family methyltransferase
MGFRQFAHSLALISRSEHVNRPYAALRHVYWQGRKLAFPRPLTLPLSRSFISDNEPGGVISMVNLFGLYDYNNMHLVQMVLRGGRCMFDVGANIGSYTLIASEDPQAFVLSLEPNPTAYAKLLNNLALNRRANVTALNVGASSRPGRLRMTNLPATVLNRVVETPAPDEPTIEVPVTTLDQLCAEHGRVPAVVKVDVEGHEPAVLQGATACIAHADAMLIENGERPEVVDLLRRHGHRGPFYYCHRKQRLDRTPQRLPEDAVFIGPGFTQRFPDVFLPAND